MALCPNARLPCSSWVGVVGVEVNTMTLGMKTIKSPGSYSSAYISGSLLSYVVVELEPDGMTNLKSSNTKSFTLLLAVGGRIMQGWVDRRTNAPDISICGGLSYLYRPNGNIVKLETNPDSLLPYEYPLAFV